MKKKGFTLVELLAVIAILAILVIIALPNVINLYIKAQKETFLTETKKICTEAEKKFISDSISNKITKVINSEGNTKLDMTGEKLQYCVILDNSGKVTSMKVSNGKWIASLDNNKTVDELTIDDLDEGNLNNYECGSASTSKSCFEYEVIPTVSIVDADKCKAYLSSNRFYGVFNNFDQAIEPICSGEKYEGVSIFDSIVLDNILDYTAAGLEVDLSDGQSKLAISYYDFSCGTNVVIPEEVDGKVIAGINKYAFIDGKLKKYVITANSKINYNSYIWESIIGTCGFTIDGKVITNTLLPC